MLVSVIDSDVSAQIAPVSDVGIDPDSGISLLAGCNCGCVSGDNCGCIVCCNAVAC